ncbi:MAG: hypothetical protein HC869_18755, partial [Rhodospirillales bacterium]|nr:hypothetical protein [Rhodospirillales bacterium]
ALEAKNQQLAEQNARLEEANDRQTDQIAQSRAKASSADWASKVSWRGDLRYRHEWWIQRKPSTIRPGTAFARASD